MKQILIIMAFISALGFNASAGEGANINPTVINAFEKTFGRPAEVNWKTSGKLYVADFLMNTQYVTAYYSATGQLLGLRKNILTTQLPIFLQASLKDQAKGFWISGLMEVANADETTYYVVLENSVEKLVLRSSHNSWTYFNRVEK
jgi:hypothetical protein